MLSMQPCAVLRYTLRHCLAINCRAYAGYYVWQIGDALIRQRRFVRAPDLMMLTVFVHLPCGIKSSEIIVRPSLEVLAQRMMYEHVLRATNAGSQAGSSRRPTQCPVHITIVVVVICRSPRPGARSGLPLYRRYCREKGRRM